jgi:hypothetical protein
MAVQKGTNSCVSDCCVLVMETTYWDRRDAIELAVLQLYTLGFWFEILV